MIIRTASPMGIPAWQPWVGLAEGLLFTVFIVWIGGRIFRMGILMQGGFPQAFQHDQMGFSQLIYKKK